MNFSRAIKVFLVVLAGLILINLGFLNYKVLFEKKPPVVEEKLPVSACPTACLDKIAQIPTGMTGEIEKEPVSTAAGQATPTSLPVLAGLPAQAGVKEFYVPLGSGETKSRDWEELAGVEAVIDSQNFLNVKSVIFEAVLRIPTANGRAYAKLYDVTNKHDVWFSEVSSEGSANYRAESGNINFSPGRNLYRVMMKSTMGYEAILNSARIKIILK